MVLSKFHVYDIIKNNIQQKSNKKGKQCLVEEVHYHVAHHLAIRLLHPVSSTSYPLVRRVYLTHVFHQFV